MSTGVIKKVAGPLVIASGMRDANMFDVVRVSEQRLIGEIIEMHGDEASIQVYEETSGLGPGEPVESMEVPMSVELGPGLITSIYGFATLGLSICPVKNREEAKDKLRQLADGKYGVIYITEAVAAQLTDVIEEYQERTFPAIIQIPGVSGNTGAGVEGVKKTMEQAVGSDILFSEE